MTINADKLLEWIEKQSNLNYSSPTAESISYVLQTLKKFILSQSQPVPSGEQEVLSGRAIFKSEQPEGEVTAQKVLEAELQKENFKGVYVEETSQSRPTRFMNGMGIVLNAMKIYAQSMVAKAIEEKDREIEKCKSFIDKCRQDIGKLESQLKSEQPKGEVTEKDFGAIIIGEDKDGNKFTLGSDGETHKQCFTLAQSMVAKAIAGELKIRSALIRRIKLLEKEIESYQESVDDVVSENMKLKSKEAPVDVEKQKLKRLSHCQFLIKFQEWMNRVTQDTPMRLETDFDDVAMMFLTEAFPSPKELEQFDKDIFKLLSKAPVQLPCDIEIERCSCPDLETEKKGWIRGAKWMRDKIQSTLK